MGFSATVRKSYVFVFPVVALICLISISINIFLLLNHYSIHSTRSKRIISPSRPASVASFEQVCSRVGTGGYLEVLEMSNIIDKSTASMFIEQAEKQAVENGGWTRNRHDRYPTTDLNTADILSIRLPVENIVYRDIIPKMTEFFKLEHNFLGISEVFIAKYSAAIQNHQRDLAMHQDGSEFSFVVTLNDEFEGGGTVFNTTGAVYAPGAGSVVAFCGKQLHGGVPVNAGTRYIMAGFLNYGEPNGCAVLDDNDLDRAYNEL